MLKETDLSLAARLHEIDAQFASGGLQHSAHNKTSTKFSSSIPTSARSASTKGASKKPQKPVKRGPAVLRIVEWQQFSWLVHGFSTRPGGVSTIYSEGARIGELNLGFTPSDTARNVEKNRELFMRSVHRKKGQKSSGMPLILLRQIHSGLIHQASAQTIRTTVDSALRGDGSIAAGPGILVGIQTADCLPILVADVRLRIVAAFHAGWRGTLARIVERGIGRMRAEFGSRPADLTAAIGPGIGGCCYAVGEEVRMEFSSQFTYADALFQEVFDLDPIKEKYPMLFLTARAPGHSNLGPSLHLDLAEANRRQLLDAGLSADKIHAMGLCTACDRNQFFSHRAEHGFTGRMLSVIGVQLPSP